MTLFSPACSIASGRCDLSLLTIDLKYNDEDGVKICEIQQGLNSELKGVSYLWGANFSVATLLAERVSRYGLPVWYSKSGISSYYLTVFKKQKMWCGVKSLTSLLRNRKFLKNCKGDASSKRKISDYSAIVLALYREIDREALDQMDEVLVLNRTFLEAFGDHFFTDKMTMHQLYQKNSSLLSLRPQTAFYTKFYSTELIAEILNTFSQNRLVIKPRCGFQGRGVLIIDREELDHVLQSILLSPEKLKALPDSSWSHWASDTEEEFLVEEYIPSLSLKAPLLGKGDYDGTMRVIVFLSHENGTTTADFLCAFWKLPKASLQEKCTLTEKHKSFSGSDKHYSAVSDEVLEKVYEQLRPALMDMYEYLNYTETHSKFARKGE